MSAAHVRRGGPARAKPRKSAPKRSSSRVGHARANRLAGLAFAAFLLAMGVVVVIALDIPSKAATSAGSAIGRAGFTVSGYEIVGLNRMNRALVDAVIVDELRQASDSAGGSKPAQPLVDVADIRNRLLQFGWVKDARVSRRLPDTLVIDIVERQPAALWQDRQRLALIDREGVVLDRVRVDQMPDLPLLIGPGANARARELDRLMSAVPTLKPQLASATWIGRRRWDLAFQTGETVALPEGEAAARQALAKFAKVDRSSGLLGRGLVRFDLRVPGKMIVRLPRAPGEAITGEAIATEAPAEG
ncbi:MAG TPA: cell division protein FtsQ/DivIB [Sphingomicrobium sp.]|nr:cell division protein FtsQ/DivIB [Sphingomicrobium sp.]